MQSDMHWTKGLRFLFPEFVSHLLEVEESSEEGTQKVDLASGHTSTPRTDRSQEARDEAQDTVSDIRPGIAYLERHGRADRVGRAPPGHLDVVLSKFVERMDA